MGYMNVYCIGGCAFLIALCNFALQLHFGSTGGPGAVIGGLAFAFIAMLSFTVASTLRKQEQRLARLERGIASQQNPNES
jgi:hypothetical protein